MDDRSPARAALGQAALRQALRQALRFGAKGYLAPPRAEQLVVAQGGQLIPKLRTNMRPVLNVLLDLGAKLLLRKRALIETINDQLNNICQIEHTRHRSPVNLLVYLMAGLTAYCHQPKNPSLVLDGPVLAAA